MNVAVHPTAAWAAQQLVETFPEETAPKYLLRDRDAIYGDVFVRRVKGLGTSEILITPSSALAESLRGARHRVDSTLQRLAKEPAAIPPHAPRPRSHGEVV